MKTDEPWSNNEEHEELEIESTNWRENPDLRQLVKDNPALEDLFDTYGVQKVLTDLASGMLDQQWP